MKRIIIAFSLAALAFSSTACKKSSTANRDKTHISLLNVSYDPTREFYAEVNTAFEKQWKAKHGSEIEIKQSHGGSGKQARSVIDGLEADVVTLALGGDIDMLYKEGKLVSENWQARFPDNSAPYTSTIVFVVRKGNPKSINDWGDLVKSDIKVITPDPKTSGGARWNYLAAWAWAEKNFSKDEAKIMEYMTQLFKNVPVRDTGARAATTTFAQRGIGDVFLSWENEAMLIEKEFPGKTEIIYPSMSILAEPPVAVVEKNAQKNGTAQASEEYLQFLYTEEAQELAAKHFYRPRSKQAVEKFPGRFPEIPLVNIGENFGGWGKAQAVHFADGGTYDKVGATH